MARLTMWLVPLLAGCSEYRVSGPETDGAGGVPDIAVDPEEVDFGSIAQGSPATRSVRVSNRGTAPLEIAAVTIEGAAFSVPAVVDPVIVLPGGSSIQEVTWSPVEDVDEGTLRIASNDPDTPDLDVPLSGRGVFGALEITPDPLSFTELSVGCATTAPVVLRNTGEGPLTVNGLSVTGTGFLLESAPVWPVLLEPGVETSAEVRFEPLAGGDALTGTIAVESTDRRGLQSSGIEGVAVEPAHVVDSFEQADGSRIDLMFFIDSSCSMTDDAENLASNFDLFLDQLLTAGVDYQVMVVTDMDGCHNVDIVTPYTIDAEQVFADATIGVGGGYSEAGLVVTSLALALTDVGECNEGFLRIGVPAVTVMVSDEPDQSPLTWLDQVLAIQASAPDAVVNGVIGQLGSTCGATNGSGYHEAIASTDGVDLDICDADWGTYVSEILGTADLLSSFPLSALPDPLTLTVTVDGTAGQGWTWDDVNNEVEFDIDMLPPESATIVVEYDEAVTCT